MTLKPHAHQWLHASGCLHQFSLKSLTLILLCLDRVLQDDELKA